MLRLSMVGKSFIASVAAIELATFSEQYLNGQCDRFNDYTGWYQLEAGDTLGGHVWCLSGKGKCVVVLRMIVLAQ